MAEKIKIWGRTTSINVQKALIALSECTLDYEQEIIGRQHGGTFEADYYPLNPNGNIPTLKDGDFILWESNAIVAYLCEKYGTEGLRPQNEQERALCHQWMIWQITVVYPILHPVFLSKIRTAEYKGSQEAVDMAPEKMSKALDILETQLDDRDFILGDRFSMADIPLGTILKRWFTLMGSDGGHKNVQAWQKRLNQRQSFMDYTNLPLE